MIIWHRDRRRKGRRWEGKEINDKQCGIVVYDQAQPNVSIKTSLYTVIVLSVEKIENQFLVCFSIKRKM